ncbi:GOLPH3/VPS74 family protein [Winogradskya humida]|uniref:GPP34 family phosphoprotein n=1 Tax=Winogradskya humida TaxID=113566 RepID=A0ABQ3ZN96_9ACTN|nr:GPP34 family phosphoprotein [Actinoplanes humidus]GIE20023.1 GPP34 family phosphoprotein [Actinoplanes humidus]
MNLAEEFALLAYGDDGAPVTDGIHLDNGLAGALLLELALAGRADIEEKNVVIRDATPTGDPLVDDALARIAADEKNRKPSHWVSKLAKDARKRTMERLVETEVLEKQKDKVLLVFNRTRYPAPHGVQPTPETEARQRLTAAVTTSAVPDPRTAALCALVGATDLDRKIFRELDRKEVKARLKEISEGSWAAAAVKSTIDSIQAAIMVSIVAATSTAAATS